MPELDDHELLAEFARSESEAAFAALAARYVNLVYSTARRFAGDPHHAEEITQAVFIILAHKAGKMSPRTVLSGWLYQTARLTAANFVKGEIRRQHREQEAYMQSILTNPEAAAWQQLAPHLDEAMGRLGETDRNAIVLRFFENKTAREVGAALKLTEAAAHKRVNRALDKLRKIFSKRGLTLSSVIIAGAVSANSVQAAPAGLAATISTTAVKGAAVAATVSSLVKGTLKIMAYTKLKLAVGIAAGIILAGGATMMFISRAGGDGKLAAQKIIRDSQDAYAALSSYSDDGKVVEQLGGQTLTTTFKIRLQRPNLYRIEWSQAVTPSFTNGGVVWSAGDGDFMLMNRNGRPIINPEKHKDMQTALASATGVSGQASATIPGTFFKQNWGNALNPASLTLQKQSDERVDGVDCYVVSSRMGPKAGQAMAGQNTTTTVWIGKLDHLIHQTQTLMEAASIRLPQFSDTDLRNMLQQQSKAVTPEAIAALRKQLEATTKQAQTMIKSGKLVFTQTHENTVLNQKFSPADFAP
jgi:RNA polymerase sigma factor (sigma-70 family)